MKTKIKTFEFRLSNYTGNFENSIKNYSHNPEGLSSVTNIDDQINNEIAKESEEGWEVKDIKISNYTLVRHNNGGCDSVFERHTIIFVKE